MLLSNEINNKDDFKKLILEDDEDSQAIISNVMEVDEERKEEVPQTIMIDTTEKGIAKKSEEKKNEETLKAEEKKRSASLKLALMLIGTMRLVSKSFRVNLLKGLLLEADYFQSKGSSVIDKQSQLNSTIEPPLIVIMKATDQVKKNLKDLEAKRQDLTNETSKESLDLIREHN